MAQSIKKICLQCRRPGFDPWVRKITWRRKWQPIPVFLPGESHGQRSLNKIDYLYIKVYSSWASLVGQTINKISLQCRRPRFDPWVRKIPWRRKWQPIAAFLTGESHGQRSLVGFSPWGHKESDMTEQLSHTLINLIPYTNTFQILYFLCLYSIGQSEKLAKR